MPSWNIHAAHVENLLATEDSTQLGLNDTNAFLLGNMLPDLYVGYVVPEASKRIPYQESHLAEPAHVPLPRADIFWERYIAHELAPNELVLGAWAHLLCDNVYNAHTRRFLQEHHIATGEQTRIRKQADYALFGRTLKTSLRVKATPALLAMCRDFPQYRVEAQDVYACIEATNRLLEQNEHEHLAEVASYSMLSHTFFKDAFDDACAQLRAGLISRV